MNNIEDRLRDAFRADADTIGDVLPLTAYEPAVSAAKARLRRVTRAMIPLTAAAAVAVAAVAVAALPKHSAGSNPAGQGSAGSQPRFAVVTEGQAGRHQTDAVESVEVTTGKTIDRLPKLPHERRPIAVSAFGAAGHFVVEAVGKQPCAVWFYQLRLTASGHLADLKPLAVPEIPQNQDPVLIRRTMAASATAPIVVSITAPCRPDHRLGIPQVHVINVATKKVTTWTLPKSAAPAGPQSVAVSGDGRLVGLALWVSTSANHAGIFGYVVPANSPSGPIARHWRKVADYTGKPTTEAANDLALSPNGKTMLASVLFRSHGKRALGLLLDSTGHQTAPNEVTAETRISVFKAASFRPLTFSLDHSGHYLLIGSGFNGKDKTPRTAVINLTNDHQRMVPNLIARFYSSIAW